MTTPLAPFAGLSQDDFLTAEQDLMPRGIAWPRATSYVITAFWRAIAGTFKRLNDAISNFFGQELDPNLTITSLANWYALLGLPDIDWATMPQLQALLVWRLLDMVGPRASFADSRYIAMMATLGITITVAHPAAWQTVIHAPAALTPNVRATLVALITPRIRGGITLSFVYDL